MPTLLTILRNPEQRRLRTFWRLLLAPLCLLACFLVFSALSGVLGYALLAGTATDPLAGANPSDLVQQLSGQPLIQLAGSLLPLLTVVTGVALAGRVLDHRPLRAFGFNFSPAWWADFGFGLALGAVLMALIFVAELALGWVTITGTFVSGSEGQPFLTALLVPISLFIAVGVYEELLVRGYLLRNLAEGLNWPALGARRAIILALSGTAVIFGLMHAGNQNSSALSTINLALAGVFLGLGYVLTGELAIPIGLHMTWNFFQGNVFGFPVSGNALPTTFVAVQQGGPELWTGGAFGPEAGLLGVLAMLAGSTLIMAWVRVRRGRLVFHEPLAEYRPANVRQTAPSV